MTVHVDEVQTRVVPAPPTAEDAKSGGGQPKAQMDEAWAAAYRLVQRDGCRTSARDFDD